MPVKHCIYASCNSDSRYPEDGVFFIPFPKPHVNLDKSVRWLNACNRSNFTLDMIKKHTYICCKHFVGGDGPTSEHPDPLQCLESKIKVRRVNSKFDFRVPNEMEVKFPPAEINGTSNLSEESEYVYLEELDETVDEEMEIIKMSTKTISKIGRLHSAQVSSILRWTDMKTPPESTSPRKNTEPPGETVNIVPNATIEDTNSQKQNSEPAEQIVDNYDEKLTLNDIDLIIKLPPKWTKVHSLINNEEMITFLTMECELTNSIKTYILKEVIITSQMRLHINVVGCSLNLEKWEIHESDVHNVEKLKTLLTRLDKLAVCPGIKTPNVTSTHNSDNLRCDNRVAFRHSLCPLLLDCGSLICVLCKRMNDPKLMRRRKQKLMTISNESA